MLKNIFRNFEPGPDVVEAGGTNTDGQKTMVGRGLPDLGYK